MNNEEHTQKFHYRIGEIADFLKVNPSLLRFWEKEFGKFITPQRNKRGVRLYSHEDFETFKRLHTLIKIEGLTLKGAGDKLRSMHKAPDDREQVLRSLTGLREFLLELKKQLK